MEVAGNHSYIVLRILVELLGLCTQDDGSAQATEGGHDRDMVKVKESHKGNTSTGMQGRRLAKPTCSLCRSDDGIVAGHDQFGPSNVLGRGDEAVGVWNRDIQSVGLGVNSIPSDSTV